MAISAPVASLQYPNIRRSIDALNVGNPLYELSATLGFTAAGFTAAGSGDLTMLRLPAGRVRVRLDLSRIVCPIATVNADLDIGFAAYTKADGTAQALQGAVLADSLDVGGGALDQNLAAGTVALVNSLDGVDVVCSFDTANSPAAGLMRLTIIYQREL